MKVVPIIETYLENRLSDERKTGCFHPSAISGCLRKLYDSYLLETTVAPEGNPGLSRIFDNGKHVHLRIQDYLKESGILIMDEVEFYDEDFEICGSADGIINIGGSLGIIEIKSINSDGFLSMIKPKNEHIEQLNVYMYALSKCFPINQYRDFNENNKDFDENSLTWGIILYENKNDQKLKEYKIDIDYKIVSKLMKKIKKVKEYLERKEVPPKEACEGCRWCDIKDCKEV